jgi:triacylglycerol lipase
VNAADVPYARLALYAEDMYDPAHPDQLAPTPDPRIGADGWTLCGYLTATDAFYRSGPPTPHRPCGKMFFSLARPPVYYGFLARSVATPGTFAVAIRGTEDFIEWIEDAEFALTPHPAAGRVEAGFYGIYRSLAYEVAPLVQSSIIAPSAALALAPLIGKGTVTVIGHSLGAALAAYMALDFGRAGVAANARLWASPRPGDESFVGALGAAVPDFVSYAYELDLVPRIPLGFDYTGPPGAEIITPGSALARIRISALCNHHMLSYLAMTDPAAVSSADLEAADLQYVRCILGIQSA